MDAALPAHQERSTAQDSMCTRLWTSRCRLCSVLPLPGLFIFRGSTSLT